MRYSKNMAQSEASNLTLGNKKSKTRHADQDKDAQTST